MKPTGPSTFALMAVAAASMLGCNTNVSGRLAAVGTGDLSVPPLERVVSGALGACGATNVTSMGQQTLRRRPYLQNVSKEGASVMWTATASAEAPATVRVTTVAGEAVAAVEAAPDRTTALSRGALQWKATVGGLEPGTRYCYEVRHGADVVLSGATFATAPAAGTAEPVRILAIGDSGGGGSDQRSLLRQIEGVPADLLVHTGDIAYDDGTLADFETKFFAVYGRLLDHVPAFPASGNHDYRTADAGPYREVFALPENGGPDGIERWYSFDWGDVHLVALDTERTGPVQAAWLEADLEANELPWTIVYAHRPPFSSGEHGGDEGFQQVFLPVLERHAVDLVLTGHDHHYERFKPRAGVLHVVTGGGGRGVRLIGRSADSAFAEAVIHLVAIQVKGDTLTLHAIDAVGREFDSAVIQKAEADRRKRTPDSGA